MKRIRMITRGALATMIVAGVLALASTADATIVMAMLGNPTPNPTTFNSCWSNTNGYISNTCADGTGAKVWVIPLPMNNTGAKTPTVYHFGLFEPTDTSYCKGHIVNNQGVVQHSTSQATIGFGHQSSSLSSITLDTDETYMVACAIGGDGVKVFSVKYTP